MSSSTCCVLRATCCVLRATCYVLRFCVPPNGERSTENGERRACLLDVRFVPRLPELQPVEWILHQQFPRTFERIVLALRMSLPVFRHQDPPPVGMSREVHAEHVEHFALEPVRRGPHRGHRRDRLVLGYPGFHAHAMAVA